MVDKNKGVIVDCEGFYVSAITWPETAKRPEINAPGTPRELRNRMLPGSLFDEDAERKRFDFEKKQWVEASGFASVVNARGEFSRKVLYFKGYEHRLPTLASNEEYVFKPKPKNENTFRWIWTGEDWARPEVVAIVEDGRIVGSALQNPRPDQPNVADVLPEGRTALDEWPKKPDGEFARIGATFKNKTWGDPPVKKADKK